MAFYLSHEDDQPVECSLPEGAAAWCVYAALVLVAICVASVGHPRIAGAVLVATSVLLGLSFAPEKWWRL